MSDTAADVVALISMSLRRERARTALSLTELARRAGVAKSTLSQLENGVGNPSLETLWALAQALGIPLSRLVDPPQQGIQVIRAGEGAIMHAERAAYDAALLSSCPPGARRDIYRVIGQPGSPHLAHPHMPGTLEHLILGSGRVLAGRRARQSNSARATTSATRPTSCTFSTPWSQTPPASSSWSTSDQRAPPNPNTQASSFLLNRSI